MDIIISIIKTSWCSNRIYSKRLSEAVGTTYYSSDKKDEKQVILNLPKEAKPLWNGGDSVQKLHALKFVYERGLYGRYH